MRIPKNSLMSAWPLLEANGSRLISGKLADLDFKILFLYIHGRPDETTVIKAEQRRPDFYDVSAIDELK